MKKTLFLLFFALIEIGVLNAQNFLGVFASDNLIKETNYKAVVLVEQSYQLKDSKGNAYGLDNKPEFGKMYSFGILIENGLIVDDRVTHPWNFDSNYDSYKENREYTPTLFETSIKPYGEKEFIKIQRDENSFKELRDNCFKLSCQSQGLNLADTTGKVNGWMVWVMQPTESEITKDTEYNVYLSFVQEVDVKASGFEVLPPQNTQKVIAGFFIVPHITLVGTVTFELCSFAYNDSSAWKLYSIIQDKTSENETKPEKGKEENDDKKPKVVSGGKLTPVENCKKGNVK